MARKPTDPTKPTVNKDGKDSYTIKTVGDLVVLYHHLPAEKRELLVKDTIGGLQKGADSLDRAPALLRPIIKAALRVSPIKWIDDDKGRVTVSVKLRAEDEKSLYSREL